MTQEKSTALTPVKKLDLVLHDSAVQKLFIDALHEHSDSFITSIINLANATPALQQCQPKDVAMECLKAATLGLDIDPSLGFAYIIPYKISNVGMKPHFQLGYKGWIQLAQNTGKYKTIYAGPIYEGVTVITNMKTGEITLTGKPTSATPIGYIGYFKLLNGFEKEAYMDIDELMEHAKEYSKAYQYDLQANKKSSLWSTNPEAMCLKTMILKVLKYGPMSTQMKEAMREESVAVEYEVQQEIDENANQKPLDPGPAQDVVKQQDEPGDQDTGVTMEAGKEPEQAALGSWE
jgi:recombination protein RecT